MSTIEDTVRAHAGERLMMTLTRLSMALKSAECPLEEGWRLRLLEHVEEAGRYARVAAQPELATVADVERVLNLPTRGS